MKNKIKIVRAISTLCLSLLSLFSFAQTPEWTWMNGNQYSFVLAGDIYGLSATYIDQGNYNSATHPGNTEHCVGWTDLQGNFWVYGGQAINDAPGCCTGFSNSMWKYKPSLNQWAWVKGNSYRAPSGPSYPSFCAGPQANYGTVGVANSTNDVGGRRSSSSWTDLSGNLWLFGGSLQVTDDGSGSWSMHYFNDLWKFVPSTTSNSGVWTCMKRTNNNAPYYWDDDGNVSPTDGDPTNDMPGARMRAKQWIDANGDLWMFGGAKNYIYGGGGNLYHTDMWKFNIASNNWSLENGSVAYDLNEVRGSVGVFNSSYHPGSRIDFISWTSKDGRYLWLYGGTRAGVLGLPTSNAHTYADMWCFDTQIKQWAFMGPNDNVGISVVPTYGTKGVSNINNDPGSRDGSMSWVDDDGNFWLFSGLSYDGIWLGGGAYVNPVRTQDVWKFTFDGPGLLTGKWAWMAGPDISTKDGYPTYNTTFGVPDINALPGAVNGGASFKDANNLYYFGGWGFGKASTGGEAGDLWKLTIPTSSCVAPSAPSLASTSTSACVTSPATLTAVGCAGGVISWNTGATGSSIVVTSAGSYFANCTVAGCTSSNTTFNILSCTSGTTSACSYSVNWGSGGVTTCSGTTTFTLIATGGSAEFSTNGSTWFASNYGVNSYTFAIPSSTSCVSFWCRPTGCLTPSYVKWGCYIGNGPIACPTITVSPCTYTVGWGTSNHSTCAGITTFSMTTTGGPTEFSSNGTTWNSAIAGTTNTFTYSAPSTTACVSFWIRPAGCTDVSKVVWGCYTGAGYPCLLPTGIESQEAYLSSISIYPNPSKSEVNILGVTKDEVKEIVVKDILGRELIKQINSTSLNIESLANGNYFIQIITINNMSKVLRFVKE